MHIVPKTKHGQILWDEKSEVPSLEEFASKRSKRLHECGLSNDTVAKISDRCVEHRDSQGRVVETFHLCHATEWRLL